MGNLLDGLGQLIIQYPSWKYLILGGGMILQGEITILISAYLVVNGSLSWKEFLTVGPLALLIAESFIYANGKILRNTRFGWRLYRRIKPNRRLQFYLFYLKKNLIKLFIISKFLPATNLVLFFLTGWTKTKWSQFLKSYFLSLFVWFGGMTIIAYSLASGLYLLKTEKVFAQVELAIGAVLLLIIAAEFVAKRVLKKFMAIHEKATTIGEIIEKEIGS
jgi:membrane protein DedA with SNARE-associated domain